MLRTTAARDTGKSSVSLTPAFLGTPFNEQQLKQLRAQCIVFLALRNGLVPKKLHLEIALGDIFPREGGNVDGSRRELIDTVKAQSSGPSSTPGVVTPFGRLGNARETDRIPPGASTSGISGGNVDGSRRELIDTVKAQSSGPSSTPGVVTPFGRLGNARETDRIPPGASTSGRYLEADFSSKVLENLKMIDKSGPSQVQPCVVAAPAKVAVPDQKPVEQLDHVVQSLQAISLSATHDGASRSSGPTPGQVPSVDLGIVASDVKEVLSENSSSKGVVVPTLSLSNMKVADVIHNASKLKAAFPAVDSIIEPYTGFVEGISNTVHHVAGAAAPRTQSMDVENGAVVPENTSEDLGAPSSSFVIAEEKNENQTERDPVVNSVEVEESKGSEAD